MPANAVVRARIDAHIKEEAAAVLAAMSFDTGASSRIVTISPDNLACCRTKGACYRR